jgi:mercuric ion transport protein
MRKFLPTSLAGLAGVACAACCVLPFLLAAGVISGAGWAAAGHWMPGVAVTLTALAGVTWWWAARRRHRAGCSGTPSCGCT